jgi:hypothetical protein
MSHRHRVIGTLVFIALAAVQFTPDLPACCPAPPLGKAVVNADQTVVILWDAANKTEHFVRKASFQSAADDFGFIVPTPAHPELAESGNDAFPFLATLTAPEYTRMARPKGNAGCGCGREMAPDMAVAVGVKVLDDKMVAGFHAVVLEAGSADALVEWLREHGYAFSPEVKEWATPYIAASWKFTALQVAKPTTEKEQKSVSASSLRISFKTDQPLFPYREPDPKQSAAALGIRHRLLRVYFIADARFRGEITPKYLWTGKLAWSNKIDGAARSRLLDLLKLPSETGPAAWWLTEFEDDWPYRAAPADLTFVKDDNQQPVKRPPIVQYVSTSSPDDASVYALAGVMFIPPLVRRVRRKQANQSQGPVRK